MLSFQDGELPSEDVIEKNLGLYIWVNINGIPVKKAFIGIGSNVNICFDNFLQKYFSFIYAKIKRTIISIKGFDNTQKECISYVTMPIEVGGKSIDQKVNVFQIDLTYTSCLVDHGFIRNT